MKNLVMNGCDLDVTTPSGGMVSGTAYLIGSAFGVAKLTTAEGEPNVLVTEGVFDLPKEGAGSGQVLAFGTLSYWDNTNKRLTNTSSGNTKVGYAVAAALTGATLGRYRLVPSI